MRKQPYPVALLGGVNTSLDPVFLMDRESSKIENVRLHKGLVKKGRGSQLFGTAANTSLPLDGAVVDISSFIMYSGDANRVISTENYSYRYSSSNGGTYTKLNANNAWTGGLSNRFTTISTFTANGNDAFVITNGVDSIFTWDGGLASDFTALGGWANITCKALTSFASRLVAGYTTESNIANPRRVRWSTAGNIANTNGTGSGFVDLVETADNVVKLVVLQNRLFVFKETSLWELVHVGGSTVFQPSVLMKGVGCAAPGGVVETGDAVVFYSDHDIYMFDGGSLTSIGNNVREGLFNRELREVNEDYISRTCSLYNKSMKKVIFSLPGRDESIPTKQYTYDLALGEWVARTKEVTAYGEFRAATSVSWDDLVGDWANLVGIWSDLSGSADPSSLLEAEPGARLLLMGDSNGYVYIDTGKIYSNDYMCYDSKDFVLGYSHRWIELFVEYLGDPSNVSFSLDSGNSWSPAGNLSTANNWSTFRLPLNVSGSKIRFRFESSSNRFELKYFVPYYIPRSRVANVATGA